MSNRSFFTDSDLFSQWGGSEELIWKKNEPKEDSEEDYDRDNEPFLPNNAEFQNIDPEFKAKLLETKHRIYEESVLKPNNESEEAQDLQLIDLYETYIKMFYLLAKESEKNKPISSTSLSLFPVSVITPIRELLSWISSFFLKNTPRETIPYSHYIELHLHTNPYFQDDLFISDKNRK